MSQCVRQDEADRVKEQIAEQIRQQLENLIQQQIQEQLESDPTSQNIQQQIENLDNRIQEAQKAQNQTEFDQLIDQQKTALQQLVDLANKVLIPNAIRNVSNSNVVTSQAARNALTQAASSVATRTTIPQSVITTNLSQRYGAQVVQAVRQACSI